MKKILLSGVLILWSITGAFATDIEDDSIVTEIDKTVTQELKVDFKMKSFDSCDAFEDVMETYMKSYWENNYKNYNYRSFGIPMTMEMSVDGALETEQSAKSVSEDSASAWGEDDFSSTNTQVLGVDESDIVKTDGKYHYYYNETQKAVYIVQTSKTGISSKNDLEVVKKINIPESFYGIELYVTDNRLAIIASSYSHTDYSKAWYSINRNTKTYTIVFDTSNIEKPELIKLYSSDGNYTKSRRIGDYIYVLSNNYFSYPYYNIKDADDIEIDAKKFLPQHLDISKTNNSEEQNLVIQDKSLPYSVVAGDVTDCNSISYSFPDEETLKNSSFNPGYNIISVININDTKQSVTTKVVAGSNSEIYMSNNNLYMTEGIWQADNFSCPRGAMCAMPFFWGGSQNTLIHKLNIDESDISYQDSALVPGSPLNQYSMDEYEWNFRIITSQWSPERSTGLYILDEDLESVSNLTNLAPGETFRSSRFIGDKLFLVTFEQIDPLFAIDLSGEKPVVLWELKIPGFSTYLHPYDDNHLIWLGYDTEINEWGGTQTAGVKVDLYKINYDKKCWDNNLTAEQEEKCESGDYKGIIVEQLYTETMWGKWSYSEALNNPRMFVWNKDRNTLLLPATLYEKDDSWRTTDYYNGLFSIKIDKESGIQVEDKISHIDISWLEEKRLDECKKYSSNWEPTCRETVNGDMICEDQDEYRWYVPNYCYKDSSIWSYVGDKSWEFRDMQVKRALYIGDRVYAISDSKITSHDWDLDEKTSIELK
jgi:inhibitor of cysteine peptidase